MAPVGGDFPGCQHIISEIAKDINSLRSYHEKDDALSSLCIHDAVYGLLSPFPLCITKRHTIHLLV